MEFKEKLNKILIIIITVLAAIIIMGTAAGFISKKAVPGKNLRSSDPLPSKNQIESLNKHNSAAIDAFTGLGKLRVGTSDGVPVVITPWLAYPEGDTVFFEELSRKRLVISGVFIKYFQQYSQQQLLEFAEEKIKADLLSLINDQLVLGKISSVYFTDYIFLN